MMEKLLTSFLIGEKCKIAFGYLAESGKVFNSFSKYHNFWKVIE